MEGVLFWEKEKKFWNTMPKLFVKLFPNPNVLNYYHIQLFKELTNSNQAEAVVS